VDLKCLLHNSNDSISDSRTVHDKKEAVLWNVIENIFFEEFLLEVPGHFVLLGDKSGADRKSPVVSNEIQDVSGPVLPFSRRIISEDKIGFVVVVLDE
jgi:hypothetical protein